MTTLQERNPPLAQVLDQIVQETIKTTITQLARKIHLKIKRLEAAGKLGDKPQWDRFYRNLHPLKQQILLRYTDEIFEQVREMKTSHALNPADLQCIKNLLPYG